MDPTRDYKREDREWKRKKAKDQYELKMEMYKRERAHRRERFYMKTRYPEGKRAMEKSESGQDAFDKIIGLGSSHWEHADTLSGVYNQIQQADSNKIKAEGDRLIAEADRIRAYTEASTMGISMDDMNQIPTEKKNWMENKDFLVFLTIVCIVAITATAFILSRIL